MGRKRGSTGWRGDISLDLVGKQMFFSGKTSNEIVAVQLESQAMGRNGKLLDMSPTHRHGHGEHVYAKVQHVLSF